MTTYRLMLATPALAAGLLALTGCGPSGRVKEQEIEVKEDSPVKQAEKLLQNYANGQKLGSESTQFEYLVNEVRKTDPTRGAILEKGFADLQKPKADTKAKAKEILRELAPKQTAG